MSGKFHPKLNETGKQDEERCCVCVACESLKRTTHSSAIRHIKKSLSFWWKAKHFLFLFYGLSRLLQLSLWPACEEAWSYTAVVLFPRCLHLQRHLHIQLYVHLPILLYWISECSLKQPSCLNVKNMRLWVVNTNKGEIILLWNVHIVTCKNMCVFIRIADDSVSSPLLFQFLPVSHTFISHSKTDVKRSKFFSTGYLKNRYIVYRYNRSIRTPIYCQSLWSHGRCVMLRKGIRCCFTVSTQHNISYFSVCSIFPPSWRMFFPFPGHVLLNITATSRRYFPLLC